MVNEDKEYR